MGPCLAVAEYCMTQTIKHQQCNITEACTAQNLSTSYSGQGARPT